jgi:SAM-dependent methyltransferase
MDMAQIDPLFRALARLVRPGGRFVFVLCHPCFNQGGAFKTWKKRSRRPTGGNPCNQDRAVSHAFSFAWIGHNRQPKRSSTFTAH